MRFFGFIISLFTIVFPVFSQDEGRIVFTATAHDFGVIKEDKGPVDHTFIFVNQYHEPLRITDVDASCGCTTSGWTKEEVQPGDSGFVTATFNPINRPGLFHKTLTVSSTGGSEKVILHIKGSVLPEPETIQDEYPVALGNLRLKYRSLHMGKMKTMKPVNRQFTIVNQSDQPIAFADSMQYPEFMQISLDTLVLLPGMKGEINIEYDPVARNDLGFLRDQITFYTNDPQLPVKQIDVVAMVEEYFPPMSDEQLRKAPSIEFLQTEHDFGNTDEGNIVNSGFSFANTGKSDLLIRKVESNCGCVTLDSIPEKVLPGESFSLKTNFDTKGRYGTQHKIITLFSNDPVTPISVLTIKGRIND